MYMQNVLIHYSLGDSISVGTSFITAIWSPIYINEHYNFKDIVL